MKIININLQSNIPKYKQIILSVEKSINQNLLKKDDKLPSINKICIEFKVSRDTVLLAYEELKKKGIVYSILGKGYFVKSLDFDYEERIFMLFDELNTFKEDIYNGFLETMNNKSKIDLFFHHFNKEMFRKLIEDSNGNYSKYVIMPCNLKGITKYINNLPKDDVYILDQTNTELKEYPSVHQNFVKDMYNALIKGKTLLKKYKKLILIFPGEKEPIGMVEGFLNFCEKYNLHYEIISNFSNNIINKGEVFIIPNDRHLVNVILQSKIQDLSINKDFGIISYNETPLKSVVENGITTISTDFKLMGKTLAEMIINNSKLQIENPCDLILRNSL